MQFEFSPVGKIEEELPAPNIIIKENTINCYLEGNIGLVNIIYVEINK